MPPKPQRRNAPDLTFGQSELEPHGGVRRFHYKSTCLTQLTFRCKLCHVTTPQNGPDDTRILHPVDTSGLVITAFELPVCSRWSVSIVCCGQPRSTQAELASLNRPGSPTVRKLTCWVCGTNHSTLEQERAKQSTPTTPAYLTEWFWASQLEVIATAQMAKLQHGGRT